MLEYIADQWEDENRPKYKPSSGMKIAGLALAGALLIPVIVRGGIVGYNSLVPSSAYRTTHNSFPASNSGWTDPSVYSNDFLSSCDAFKDKKPATTRPDYSGIR